MDYKVMVVPDYALPAGVKRVMVETRDQPSTFILAESVMDNWRFLQECERLQGGEVMHLRADASPGDPPPPERHVAASEDRPIARGRRRLGEPGWWEEAQAQAAPDRPLSFSARHPDRAAMTYTQSA